MWLEPLLVKVKRLLSDVWEDIDGIDADASMLGSMT
jgi:hypothetical protein